MLNTLSSTITHPSVKKTLQRFILCMFLFPWCKLILCYWIYSLNFPSHKNSEMILWSCTVIVLSLSCVQLFVTMWTAARQSSLSITNSRSLLKLMSIELVMPSNHPLPSPSLPTFNLSQHQGLFQWVSSSHQVAKELELQFSLSPSKEY